MNKQYTGYYLKRCYEVIKEFRLEGLEYVLYRDLGEDPKVYITGDEFDWEINLELAPRYEQRVIKEVSVLGPSLYDKIRSILY